MSYFGARYYDPEIGRFTGVDPAGVDSGNIYSFSCYVYANNNPYGFVDPDGRESEFFALRLVLTGAAADAATPDPSDAAAPAKAAGYTGAIIGTAIGGSLYWAGNKTIGYFSEGASDQGDSSEEVPNFDEARKKAFEEAGLTNPDDVEISKVDPETGTATEFKGKGGAKVGYDGPHVSPGEHHDTQHISWQSAGKRGAGGRRGNIPYSGPQHPSRPSR